MLSRIKILLIPDNNFFSLLLIADSLSLSCISGLEEFKISTLLEIA